MATFRNSAGSRCLGGGTVKNTYVILGFVVVGSFAGCSPAPVARPATSVIQEDEVKVRVDADGRPQVGAGQTADSGKAP